MSHCRQVGNSNFKVQPNRALYSTNSSVFKNHFYNTYSCNVTHTVSLNLLYSFVIYFKVPNCIQLKLCSFRNLRCSRICLALVEELKNSIRRTTKHFTCKICICCYINTTYSNSELIKPKKKAFSSQVRWAYKGFTLFPLPGRH